MQKLGACQWSPSGLRDALGLCARTAAQMITRPMNISPKGRARSESSKSDCHAEYIRKFNDMGTLLTAMPRGRLRKRLIVGPSKHN